jgi:uncharacterized protein (UPF0332 family)
MSETIFDLVKYRVSRALESLSEARVLADSLHWNACVNRLYYSCFYAVSALLALHQMKSKKHAGIRSFFNLHFVKTGLVSIGSARIYNDLFERRQEGDYEDFFVFNEAEVRPWVEDAVSFVNNLRTLIEKDLPTQ